MTDEISIAERSCLGWMSEWVRSVRGGELIERDGTVLVITGSPQEWWNIAFVVQPLEAPERTLREVIDTFEERNQPFILRVRDGLDPASERAAEALGFGYTDTLPAMVLAPVPEAPSAPAGLDIREIDDAETIEGCVSIIVEAYEMDAPITRALVPAAAFERPSWRGFVGYADGEPAATATVVKTDVIAGITLVGTRPAFRKRGFGEAVTWRAVTAGVDLGCTVASLEASEMGFPIYRRMGFRHITGFKTFVLPKYRS